MVILTVIRKCLPFPGLQDYSQCFLEALGALLIGYTHCFVCVRIATASHAIFKSAFAYLIYRGSFLSKSQRVDLNMAWDTCCSAFASRQVLYERFFQGDTQRNALILDGWCDKGPMTEMVQEFLERSATTQ